MNGLIPQRKSKGISLFKRTFQTHQQRRRALLNDSAVEDLLLLAYTICRDDLLNGVAPCNTGTEVANRLRELLV